MDPFQDTEIQFQKLLNKVTRLVTQHGSPDIGLMTKLRVSESDRMLSASQAARIIGLEKQLVVATEKTKALEKENQNLQKQIKGRIEPYHSEQNQTLIELCEHLIGCQQDISRLQAEIVDRKNGDDLMHSRVQGNLAETEQLKAWLVQLAGQQRGETINLQSQVTSLRDELGQFYPYLKWGGVGAYSPNSHPTVGGLDIDSEPQGRYSTRSGYGHMCQGSSLRTAPSPILDLDKVARAVGRFDPETEGEYTGTFLDKVDYFLDKFPEATMSDRIDVVKASSTLRVCNFIDRQVDEIRNDYKALKQALIKEFGPPEAQTGLTEAMKVKQGRHEFPKQYYDRMRKSFFGSRNHPGCDEDPTFKTLFIHNLHFSTSRYIQILATPETMTSVELCDLAVRGFKSNERINVPSAMPATYRIAITQPGGKLKKYGQPTRPSPAHQQNVKGGKRATNANNHPKRELAQQKTSQCLRKYQARTMSRGSVGKSGFVKYSPDTQGPHRVLPVQPDTENTTPWPNPDQALSYDGELDCKPTNQRFLGTLIRKGPSRTLHLPVLVENRLSVDAVVDTGSDITLISSGTFKEILMGQAPGKRLKVKACSLEVQGYAAVRTQLRSRALLLGLCIDKVLTILIP